MGHLFKKIRSGESMTPRDEPLFSQDHLTHLFKEKVAELQKEPEFSRKKEPLPCAVDDNRTPAIKLAVANVPLNYDLWKGLRNPAVIGLYPAGLQHIWEFYANRRKKGIDKFGRSTIFQVPHSFSTALKTYNRALIISVMLPFSPEIIEKYTELISGKEKGSSHVYAKMYEEVNALLDKATTRTAVDLVQHHNVVVPLTNENVTSISSEAIPVTRQKASHGPSKGGNYPQKSVAALLGLGQFGVHRIIFRDEVTNGKVSRFTGPLRSIVIFDKEDLITKNSHGVIFLTEPWRIFLFSLFDFTNTDPEINKYRFCAYIPSNDAGCTKCRDYCPSGAQPNSMPASNGEYPEEVVKQTHRFWEGKLQFDYGRCCEERGQMASLFPEWSCARGLSVCAARGVKRVYAAKNFYEKREELQKAG